MFLIYFLLFFILIFVTFFSTVFFIAKYNREAGIEWFLRRKTIENKRGGLSVEAK